MSMKHLVTALVIVATGLVAGCHGVGEKAHGHADDHEGHGHADATVPITRFTSGLELFAEHPPAVTGHKLTFLAHLTLLEGFRPLERVSVTLKLDGPSRVEVRVDEKLRPGIFELTLKAPASGTYRAQLVVSGPEVDDVVDGFEIVVHASDEAAQKAHAEQTPSSVEPIRFLKEQQWQVPFATAVVATGVLMPRVEVAGEVTTPPSGQAEVGAPISGRVVAPPAGLARPGQTVKKGALLASIAPAPAAPEDSARAELSVVEAQARLQAARAAVDRAERLIADRAISQRQVDEATRELGVAEEALAAARRARDLFAGALSGRGAGLYRITAPIDGVVVEVQAMQGQAVTSGETLLRIVNLDELWIRARVPEQQATQLRGDQDAAFKLPGTDVWQPLDVTGEDADASVVHVGRTVERTSRTVEILYALRRPDARLRVGAMVRVAVPCGDPWQGLIVPRDAVLDDDGRSLVYVQVEGEAFEARAVRLGPASSGQLGIEAGVRSTERIVTRGANFIRAASRASTGAGHGHVH